MSLAHPETPAETTGACFGTRTQPGRRLRPRHSQRLYPVQGPRQRPAKTPRCVARMDRRRGRGRPGIHPSFPPVCSAALVHKHDRHRGSSGGFLVRGRGSLPTYPARTIALGYGSIVCCWASQTTRAAACAALPSGSTACTSWRTRPAPAASAVSLACKGSGGAEAARGIDDCVEIRRTIRVAVARTGPPS